MQDLIMERYRLARERLTGIREQPETGPVWEEFFRKEAEFLCEAVWILPEDEKEPLPEKTLEEWQRHNERLYGSLKGENYFFSYASPAYASEKLGEYGPLFSFLAAELLGCAGFAAERNYQDVTILLELFIQVHYDFSQEEVPSPPQLKSTLVSYTEDYCRQFLEARIKATLDPGEDFALRILMDSDLEDLRYLYRFGEYISENELETARFLNTLPQEEIDLMAQILSDGFRQGFLNAGKNIRKKKTANLRYTLGFERIARQVVRNLEEMGLKTVLYRRALHSAERTSKGSTGYIGGTFNPQFEYDHRQDEALYLTQDFVAEKLRILHSAYESMKDQARVHAGPLVMETFGEKPFRPVSCPSALTLDTEQQALDVRLMNESAQITNRYIPGDERSFAVIAWPVPEIGENYREIFRAVKQINTLDISRYRKIQQKIIDTLDSCEWVQVLGRDGNDTDLIIHLHELKHPKGQTNFENCLADVNIPLGEVFTSPVLAGTGGVLHVSGVYLNGLFFRDLRLVFDCGQVIDYSCANFPTEEENRRYIEDNILFHHAKIPMGEFAIGTNTTAYAAARRFGIEDRLPILIAEKMGPHFALGDTCYSWEEDVPVYNPDGKEMIARENEISALRKEDLSMAYYNCHTDITLPYDELDTICVIDDEGEMTPILAGGRFVLKGTEELNRPFTAGQ